MTYGGQQLKITFMFTVEGTDEVADTSISYTSAPGWTGAAAALAELDTADAVAIRGFYTDDLMDLAHISWSDYSNLVGVKIAALGTNGLYLVDPLIADTDTPVSGTATGLAPQTTVVLSLRSGFTVGKGNYGRMYLPHTTLGTQTNSPFASSTNTTAIALSAKDFVNNITTQINAATTATLFPAIMSQATGTPTRGVTSVAVGNVNDTQRRRRNRLQETYHFETLA